MNKQEVIEKLRNDEITLYTDILINDLLEDILKSAFPEDLFDLKYLKINEYYHNDNAGWDYSGYNIKKLPIINLSNIEMKKYTVRECYENKYSIWCTTVEQANIINKATGSENDWKILIKNEPFEVFIISWKTGNVYNCSYQTSCTKEYFIKEGTWDGKFATKCIDFSELKLENEMEEIIGYNYKPEFEQAIAKLLPLGLSCWNIDVLKDNLQKDGWNVKNSNESGSYVNYFKSLNIFDTFFTPVYTPQYNVGDFIYYNFSGKNESGGKVLQITKIDKRIHITPEYQNTNQLIDLDDHSNIELKIRKATQKEIENFNTKTLILGDKKISIVIKKNLIKADNTEWYIQKLEDIHKTMKPKTRYFDEKYQVSYESVKIGCVTFGMNEIKQIIDEYYKLTNDRA